MIDFMQGFKFACLILSVILAVMYSYRAVYVVIGLFRTRVFPTTKHRHRYAIVIAARNEQTVLGDLLDSIRAQDYPAELVTTFVVADNCTDRTAAIARAHGAVCYERHDTLHCSKGYALEYLFDCIERDYGRQSFEGYFVFDADNLLEKDYISRMNEAFDAGERLVTSYRNTKNFSENAISFSYGIHWLATVRSEHRARSFLHLSTRLQGTGYLFDRALVKDGWHYTSLTEDRELTAAAVCLGYRISYQDAAVFYDEQPSELRIALRQRQRWARGNLIVFLRTGGKLLGEMMRRLFRPSRSGGHRLRDSFICYDIFLTTLPETLLYVAKQLLTLTAEISLLLLTNAKLDAWGALGISLAFALGRTYLSRLVVPLYILVCEKRRLPAIPLSHRIGGALLWFHFPLIGDLCMLIALFRHVEWKPIPHHTALPADQKPLMDEERAAS